MNLNPAIGEMLLTVEESNLAAKAIDWFGLGDPPGPKKRLADFPAKYVHECVQEAAKAGWFGATKLSDRIWDELLAVVTLTATESFLRGRGRVKGQARDGFAR